MSEHLDSLVVKITNLPMEVTEEDMFRFLQGVNIVRLGLNSDQCFCHVQVKSKKDVKDCLTYDQKYL